MPRLEELEQGSNPRSDQSAWDDLHNGVRERASSFWEGFANFALRDNVLEVAVGLILASAFTAVANSLVTDMVLPIISLLPFISRNLAERFTILRSSRSSNHTSRPHYNTIQQALDDGALVWAWGRFLDKTLRFFLIAFSLFAIARLYTALSGDAVIKKQVRCAYCRKYISAKAKRCVNCSSWTDGREDADKPSGGAATAGSGS